MKALRWLYIPVAVVALSLVACIYCYGPTKGWFHRTFRTPAILHSAFIEDFDRQQAATQRQKLFSIYQAKSGSHGLRKVTSTIEGTPVGKFLIVEGGRVTVVSDYTRDAFGNREFVIQHPTNIVLAAVQSTEEAVPFTPDQGSIVLKCYFDGGVVFF
ncbi:MAG TPA: hypothetical protein VL527_12945 [Dongiaceae bacterium]|jgi:hypothetical protein|nr:hypothetical protein [Dongiaceae bacterium]